MAAQEKYIEGQEASGIEVGNEVRATRHFENHERGSTTSKSAIGLKGDFVDAKATGIVKKNRGGDFVVDCGKKYGGVWTFPYFVLEIVKKKDGSVPNKVKVKEPCVGCKHLDTDVCVDCNVYGDGSCTCHTGNPPCSYCTDSLWEEEINNPLGEPSMSTQEQKVFDVTIIERTEMLHEGSGVVQKINREILYDKKVSAVTEESAKQKALQGLAVLDLDKLEITCQPFPG